MDTRPSMWTYIDIPKSNMDLPVSGDPAGGHPARISGYAIQRELRELGPAASLALSTDR